MKWELPLVVESIFWPLSASPWEVCCLSPAGRDCPEWAGSPPIGETILTTDKGGGEVADAGGSKNSDAVHTLVHGHTHIHHTQLTIITSQLSSLNHLFIEEPNWQELGFGSLWWNSMRNGKSQ